MSDLEPWEEAIIKGGGIPPTSASSDYPKPQDDELEKILNRLDTDFHDYHDGRWDFNGLKPTEIALQALKAREEAIAVRARIDELRRQPGTTNGNGWGYEWQEYVDDRIHELTQLQGEATEGKG